MRVRVEEMDERRRVRRNSDLGIIFVCVLQDFVPFRCKLQVRHMSLNCCRFGQDIDLGFGLG